MIELPKNMLATGGGIAAATAIAVATWRYINMIWKYIIGIFIGKSILKDEAGEAAMSYAFSKAVRSPLGMRLFGAFNSYVHPKRWFETVPYESISGDPALIKYKSSYALINMGAGISGIDKIGSYEVNSTVTIRYFRWFFDIENFVKDAVEHCNYEQRQRNGDPKKQKINRIRRFKIIRNSANPRLVRGRNNIEGGNSQPEEVPTITKSDSRMERLIMLGVFKLLKWSREDLQMKPEDGQSPFTGYPFPDEVGEAIKELNGWLSNEKWFRSKSIPWRRGWLLYGIPGSGKSTLVRALGMAFDLPVYIFDLAGMTNNDFVDSWDGMMANTPCIALIEDIDAEFKGREYVGSTIPNVAHLTFDCLLNCISGVKSADGVFLIVTTNHVETLDPALGVPDKTGKSSRPGRIDKTIHLGLMQEPQRKLLAQHILSDYPELIENTVKDGEGETAAQFQSRCAQLALDKFWKDDRLLNRVEKYNEVIHIQPDTSFTQSNDGFIHSSTQKPGFSDALVEDSI